MDKKDKHDIDERSLSEILLDEECVDPITMFDENGNAVDFEQLAIIPDDEGDSFYCVMTPVKDEDEEEEDIYIFKLVRNEEDGEEMLVIEEDEEKGQKIFEAFMELLEEAEGCEHDCCDCDQCEHDGCIDECDCDHCGHDEE